MVRKALDLSEIKKEIRSRVPVTSMITEIEYEGPEIVVYAKNPGVLMENGDTVRELAKTIRKRIIIRPDPSVLTPPEEAEEKIRELVPEEAEITRITFDPSVGDVVIEAKKPGLVIGKSGQTLRDITKKVRWRARVIRTPPLTSEIIDGIRHM
ncbi:MAG: beta-CASP ribonuclease aCPSF1, partial [Methanobacteriota archaeon]